MKKIGANTLFQSVVLCAVTIAVDQWTKIQAGETVILNRGTSFGLFSGAFLTFVLGGILLAIAWKYGKLFLALSPLAAGAFFGASSSNVIDRVLYGGVRDFLPVPIFHLRNNLADWVIFGSLAWLFWKSRYNSSVTSNK